jgi:hypothetical protein
MDRSRRHGTPLACLVAGLLVLAGCSRPGGGTPAATATGSVAPAGTPSQAAESIEPAPSASADPSIAAPPSAFLAVDGGDQVEGELGSFGWLDGGSDSPWLPGNPIHVGASERLTLSLGPPVAVDTWAVSRSPAERLGDELVGMGSGSTTPVSFDAPPIGTWSVSVSVWFVDNLGSATYYWLVEVE